MDDKEFYWNCDGIELHMKLDLPAGRNADNDKYPLCILVHGYTGHMEEPHLLGARDALNELGIAVLRVELYGHGKSGGAFVDHNVMLWVHELTRVIDYAYALPFVSELYLAGHSQGGLATVLAAGIMTDKLKAILPLAPALSIRTGAREGNLLGHRFDPGNIPEYQQMDEEHTIRSSYVRIAQQLPIEAAVANYHGKVLLIHARDDETIPYSDSEWLKENYERATLIPVSGGGHCYDDHIEELKEAVKKIENYI